jgi:hypothetical protein
MDDGTLLRRFEDASIEPATLGHQNHVRIAWNYLQDRSFGEAGDRFLAGLRRFAAAHGKTALVHETITWAYLALVNERLHAKPRDGDFGSFAGANADLFVHRGGALSRIYDAETLESDLARRVFVLPRRRP